jgi:Abortive infection alpha
MTPDELAAKTADQAADALAAEVGDATSEHIEQLRAAINGAADGEADGESATGDSEAAGDAEQDEPAEEAGGTQKDLVHVNQPSEALPVLARTTAEAWLRVAAWGVGTGLRVGAQVVRAASDPSAATHLYDELTVGLRDYAREFLGITELERDINMMGPIGGGTREHPLTGAALRAQGAELLRAAADVGFDESAHPAYARILSELAPDEARVLRILATKGPQPLVDIRAGNLIGMGSQLITASMNMLGAQAGLRHREKVPVYLSNMARLGLILLSDDPLEDPLAYQVLEAQPDVLGMIKQTPRAKSIHRSVVLSPLGLDFCEVCLPLDLADIPRQLNPGNGE